MTSQVILILQSLLSFLQVVNVGIATTVKDVHPLVPLIMSGAMAAIQTYLQRAGNKLEPGPRPQLRHDRRRVTWQPVDRKDPPKV
jgi:hypothetical protein